MLQKINSQVQSENSEPFEHATQRYERMNQADPKSVAVLKMGPPDQAAFEVKDYANFLGANNFGRDPAAIKSEKGSTGIESGLAHHRDVLKPASWKRF